MSTWQLRMVVRAGEDLAILAPSKLQRADAVAVETFGAVSMTVRSRGTGKDAHAVLERFEVELRACVTRKLEERFGGALFEVRAASAAR